MKELLWITLVLTTAPLVFAEGKSTTGFSQEVLKTRIKNQDVIRLTQTKPNLNSPTLTSITLARGAGLAPIEWNVRLPDGREYNLTGALPASEIEAAYEAAAGNPFRDNLFFQNGIVATLFPMANRLTGNDVGAHVLEAQVSGQTVRMPINNKANRPNAIPHHLHGLLFGQAAEDVKVELTPEGAKATGKFIVGPDLWTGKTEVTTSHVLTKSGYVYHLHVKNIGTTPVPVGTGSHPYFASPDMESDSILVHIPARRLAEIDNLSNVLPTGKLIPVEQADPSLDFRAAQGTPLYASQIKGNDTQSRFDNLWVDPVLNSEGFAYAEVFFPRSHMKVKLTALTKNIVGIQAYAPLYTPGKRPFVVLELVTNLPDPREQLWNGTPTGMKLLRPGETFDYGYRVEVSAL